MKNIFKNISLFALGIAAVTTLASVRLTPVPVPSVARTVVLRTVSLTSGVQVAGGDDGQETHGDKGKTKG